MVPDEDLNTRLKFYVSRFISLPSFFSLFFPFSISNAGKCLSFFLIHRFFFSRLIISFFLYNPLPEYKTYTYRPLSFSFLITPSFALILFSISLFLFFFFFVYFYYILHGWYYKAITDYFFLSFSRFFLCFYVISEVRGLVLLFSFFKMIFLC